MRHSKESKANNQTSNSNNPAKAAFLEKVRQSNAACQSGDFEKAVSLYTEAIQLDPANHILYSNRSAAHIKMGQFTKALQDAIKAKELNPEWPKVNMFCHIVKCRLR
jgi:Flp pilus assembly protein TadD